MPKYADIIQKMPRSGIREIMDLAWSMDAEVTKLMVGEPDFQAPQHVIEAAKTALDKGATRYIANAGLDELREVIAERFEQKFDVQTKASNIVVTHGAMASIPTAMSVLCEPGDEILVPDPGWCNYEMAAQLFGVTPVHYPVKIENEFQPDITDIEACITERTKCIIICTPSNPTGQVYDAATMEALVDMARRHDIFLVSDEIYSDIIFEGKHVSAARFDTDGRVVVIGGVSKSYAMTGFRVGFSRGSEKYIELASKFQEPITSCGTASSQYAAISALAGPQDCIDEMRNAYHARRDLVLDMLKDNGLMQYTPRGAFYILIDVSQSGLSGTEFAHELLREDHIAVAPGSAFGPASDALIRVSLASSKADLKKGLTAITAKIKRND